MNIFPFFPADSAPAQNWSPSQATIIFLILLSLLTFVAGQLLLKVALNRLHEIEKGDPRRRAAPWIFAASIFSMAVSFFLSLGLLQKLDLSYLFPFQGLSVIIIAFSSVFLLKERLTPTLVVGVLLITAGVILVSAS
jgi:drug/metabolite transporter (DMT)-like permease